MYSGSLLSVVHDYSQDNQLGIVAIIMHNGYHDVCK